MRLKRNVGVRLVLNVEQHERVVAVFSLLVAIDKRLNSKEKKVRKSKTKSKDKLVYIYDNEGSHRGPSLLHNCLSLSSATCILITTITSMIGSTNDRYNSHYITQRQIPDQQARTVFTQCRMAL